MTDDRASPTTAAGAVHALAPGLRLVVAPNPSPMTFRGTNSYLVGTGEVALIDPGPDLAAHGAALLAALGPGERISHILVTHAHLDHSPLARRMAEVTGARVHAFGPATAGRSALMERLAASGRLSGGEGVDMAFRPDVTLADGDRVEGAGWTLEAVHTPGHLGNHLSFRWGGAVFSGDHVMGWSSSIVSPPDGDMGAYMASLDRLAGLAPARLYAGHGDPVADPQARIEALRAHRLGREAAILAALAAGPADAGSIARLVYTDTPAALMPAAERNVFAHLLDLLERSRVDAEGPPGIATRFALA